jgi:peptidoglycan hydrolase CwlO-like protein
VPTRSSHERRLAHLEALCRELEELRREARELCDALAREIARADEVNRFVSEGYDRPKAARGARVGASVARAKAKKAPNSSKNSKKSSRSSKRPASDRGVRAPRPDATTAAGPAPKPYPGDGEEVASRNYANEGDG